MHAPFAICARQSNQIAQTRDRLWEAVSFFAQKCGGGKSWAE
ncbi:hypothetical protein HMPREF0262_02331 [Clostridium sp. ATCC 29733]|nr:hypothetical protein HMPREF0262_02331 [Clostridium sp. ATCC 29733]